MITQKRRESRSKANAKWREKNRDWQKAYSKAWRKANPDKKAETSRTYNASHIEGRRKRRDCGYQKARDTLSNGYVRQLIASKTGVKAEDVPPMMIEVKRVTLKLHRLIKELRNENA